MQARKKAKKSRNTAFWPCFVAPEGRKVGSLKRRARSHLGRWEIKKLHAVVVRSRFRSQNAKTPQCRSTFGSSDVPKVRTVVGRSTFRSKNVFKKTGALLEVEMWKKRASLWREADLGIEIGKTHQVRSTFASWDVEKVYTVVAQSTFPSKSAQKASASDHLWKLRYRRSARRCGAKHISKLKVLKNWLFQYIV